MVRLILALLLPLTLATVLILAGALLAGRLTNAPMLAYTREIDARRDIHLYEPHSGLDMRLTNQPGQAFGPVWSPDGRRLAFYSQVGSEFPRIYVMQLPTGQPRPVTPAIQAGFYSSAAWSEDGRWLLFVYREGVTLELHHADVDAGYLGVLDDEHQAVEQYLATFGSGESITREAGRVYFDISSGPDWGLFFWPTDADSPRVLVPLQPGAQPISLAWSPDGRRLAFALIPPQARQALLYMLELDGDKVGEPRLLAVGTSAAWRP